MDNMFDDLNLYYDAYRASMKGSAWKNEPQKFEMDFLHELILLKQELTSKTYQTFKGSEFKLNERGKIRHIHGARMRDRVVRHLLCDNELTPKLDKYLIYNNGASQKGKGLSFSRRMFERDLHNFWLENKSNDGYIALIDYSKFYDNIQHDKIIEAVFPKISEESRWLLREILHTFEVDVSYMTDEEYEHCMEKKFSSVWYYDNISSEAKTGKKFMKKSVEIGDQVSQNIGIYFSTRVDNYVKIVRQQKYYGRYMDDLYIICKTREEAESIIKGVIEQAKEIGLFVNERKTHVAKLSETFKYLQVKYFLTDTGKVVKRINPVNVTRERRRLKAYKRLLENGGISQDEIEQAVRSWMGEYTKIMSKRQIKSMKSLYKELFGKEITWKRK